MDSSSASPSKSEINTFFGRCRCCLEYGYMKNLWSEYYWEGVREIYGEMLLETFSLTWDSVENSKEVICESCVQRLRDASAFKKEVLASEQLMIDDFDDYDGIKFKIEIQMEDSEDLDSLMKQEMSESEERQSDSEYYEVEYLEDEDVVQHKEGSTNSMEVVQTDTDSDPIKKVPKWPRRKKRDETTRVYKNYTEQDMRSCLEVIRRNQMSVSDACKYFGIPRKTVSAKLQGRQNINIPETPDEIEKFLNQEKHYNFVQELKQILTYTNAVPFKVKGNKYFCAYCYISKNSFEDPDDLRIHVRSHEIEWVAKLDRILRPHFMNEILRLDIEALRCTVCNVTIKDWESMFKHLEDLHQVELDQSRTKLIPFKLKRDFMLCVLCDQKWPNFSSVDTHMNIHYCNYMCSDCGDTFIAESRLKHHSQIHNTGKFPCEECGKMFTLERYMRKHVSMVHKRIKCFKCIYCTERFHSEIVRHAHVLEKHQEKVHVSTCEFCGKSFNWRPYYLAHLRKVHSSEKKNKCRYCPKAFVSKHEVKMHEQRHTGTGKHYCGYCNKNFVTMMELKSHINKHAKEITVIDYNQQMGGSV